MQAQAIKNRKSNHHCSVKLHKYELVCLCIDPRDNPHPLLSASISCTPHPPPFLISTSFLRHPHTLFRLGFSGCTDEAEAESGLSLLQQTDTSTAVLRMRDEGGGTIGD